VYTQNVGAGFPAPAFNDGDKNTVILDHDGTLTGYNVLNPNGTPFVNGTTYTRFPISLNDLPFLGAPNSVDECVSEGAQDVNAEGRPTSLISPNDFATMEFSELSPTTKGTINWGSTNGMCCDKTGLTPMACVAGANTACAGANQNVLIFTKDEIDYPGVILPRDPLSDIIVSDGHQEMSLSGRNGQGVYEPKLMNHLRIYGERDARNIAVG